MLVVFGYLILAPMSDSVSGGSYGAASQVPFFSRKGVREESRCQCVWRQGRPALSGTIAKAERVPAWGSRVRAPQQRPRNLAPPHPADLQPARGAAAAGSAQVKRDEWDEGLHGRWPTEPLREPRPARMSGLPTALCSRHARQPGLERVCETWEDAQCSATHMRLLPRSDVH